MDILLNNMSRKMVAILVMLILFVAALFFLSSVDAEQELAPVIKPVMTEEAG